MSINSSSQINYIPRELKLSGHRANSLAESIIQISKLGLSKENAQRIYKNLMQLSQKDSINIPINEWRANRDQIINSAEALVEQQDKKDTESGQFIVKLHSTPNTQPEEKIITDFLKKFDDKYNDQELIEFLSYQSSDNTRTMSDLTKKLQKKYQAQELRSSMHSEIKEMLVKSKVQADYSKTSFNNIVKKAFKNLYQNLLNTAKHQAKTQEAA